MTTWPGDGGPPRPVGAEPGSSAASGPRRARCSASTGGDDVAAMLTFDGPPAAALGLDSESATANVQAYLLGTNTPPRGSFQAAPPQGQSYQGDDGAWPTDVDLIGDQASRSGMYALESVDLINLLLIPEAAAIPDLSAAAAVVGAALQYATARCAFLIVDPPDVLQSDPSGLQDWVSTYANELASRNGAIYFPALEIPDPLEKLSPVPFGPGGTVAGIYARTDSAEGVWTAPAGNAAACTGALSVTYRLTYAEIAQLTSLGVNPICDMPGAGILVWGARTLRGREDMVDPYKYVPVRRLALFIEQSLVHGLRWLVFEPNDEQLWAQVRSSVGAFLHQLFTQGAFVGQTPEDAYFVRCDGTTTNRHDVDRGVLNVIVAFASTKSTS